MYVMRMQMDAHAIQQYKLWGGGVACVSDLKPQSRIKFEAFGRKAALRTPGRLLNAQAIANLATPRMLRKY